MSITPQSEQGSGKPDVLRELYQQAVADDRGPSAQSSAAILARAKQRAAAASPESAKPQSKPAANDRFWLHHALGGLAAVGLVGWLMLQHAAWWGGSDKGIGVEPDAHPAVVEEPVVPAPAATSESSPGPSPATADAGQPIAAEVAPAVNGATRQSSVTQKSKENRAVAHEDQALEAMNMETKNQARVGKQAAPAATSATAPMAAPAPSIPQSMERSASMTPNAKARASAVGEAASHAAEKSLETADIASQQNPEAQAKLPLCPLVDETQGRKASANDNAQKDKKSASGTTPKTPHCRPCKVGEKQPVPASEATEGAGEPGQ